MPEVLGRCATNGHLIEMSTKQLKPRGKKGNCAQQQLSEASTALSALVLHGALRRLENVSPGLQEQLSNGTRVRIVSSPVPSWL